MQETPTDILARKMMQEAQGLPAGTVLNAAMNIVIESIALRHRYRSAAEGEWDMVMPRAKAALLERYDRITGLAKLVIIEDAKR